MPVEGVRVRPPPCPLGSWGKNTAPGSCPRWGLGFNPREAGAVLAVPVVVAVATALVRAVGELAEFVLQVGDALLLRLDRLLQGTDLLQHLLQGWLLQGGGTQSH